MPPRAALPLLLRIGRVYIQPKEIKRIQVSYSIPDWNVSIHDRNDKTLMYKSFESEDHARGWIHSAFDGRFQIVPISID